MEESTSSPSNNLKTTRLIIRIVTSLVTLFYMLAFVPKLTQDLFGESSSTSAGGSWEGTMVTISFLIFVVGYIITFRRGVSGGIMFIVAGVLIFTSHLIASDGEFELLPFLIFSCPMVLVGVMFILFWWKET